MATLEEHSDASEGEVSVDWTTSGDVLSAFVAAAGLRGLVLASLELGAPWLVRHAAARPPVLHFVREGLALFRCEPTDEFVRLGPGDAVMLPSGGTYELADDVSSSALDLVPLPSSTGRGCSLRAGGTGRATKLLCYRYRFRDASALALLQMLPSLVVVRASDEATGLRVALDELARETLLDGVASEGIISRLAEVAYLNVLRHHFDTTDPQASGLLAAVADPHVGPALREVHAGLAEPWTVAKLAALVGLSRAAFSRVFTERTGDSPMHYVHRCRIQAAARMMIETTLSVAEVGRRVGYADQAAFARAFRRELGSSPRDYRNQHGDAE
jgi:AraC-like DNA-binding protein